MTNMSLSGASRGGARGAGAPIFLDQTKAWKAENIFLDPHPPPPPLSQGLDLTHTKHDRWSLGKAFISYFLPVLLLHYYVCSSVHVPGHACLCVLDRPLRLHSEIALRN